MRAVVAANVGEFAALAVACCWTISALSFEAAGRRVGSLSLNLIRLVMAALLLSVIAGHDPRDSTCSA